MYTYNITIIHGVYVSLQHKNNQLKVGEYTTQNWTVTQYKSII